MVFELLVADQPKRETAPDPDSKFWNWADKVGVADSRFPTRQGPKADTSHTAMSVNLDACINCTLCVRACREVQVNDVIGMAFRGSDAKVIFDFDNPMGDSTCVACGECVQACPTGALMEANLLNDAGTRTVFADKTVDSLCPFCGVGCQTTVHVKDDKIVSIDGRDGPANEQRLCVKGRFGFDYINHPHRLTKPLIRRDDAPKDWQMDLKDGDWTKLFREASWEEALEKAAGGLKAVKERNGPSALAGFGSAKCSNEEAYLFQKLVRTGFGTNNVDHCTRLCHASSVAGLMEGALPRVFGGRPDGRHRLGRGDGPLHGSRRFRMHHRDRRAAEPESSGGRDLSEAGRQKGQEALCAGPAEAGPFPLCDETSAVQAGPRRGAAECHAAYDHQGASV
jgi:formate dehydrogenase major subunit